MPTRADTLSFNEMDFFCLSCANSHSGTHKKAAADGRWRVSVEMLKRLALVGAQSTLRWGAAWTGEWGTSRRSVAVDEIRVKTDYGGRGVGKKWARSEVVIFFI